LDEAEDEAVRRAHRGLLDEIERRIEDLEEEIEEHIEENPKPSADARCWTRSRASVSKPLRSSQVNSDLLKSFRARVRQLLTQALYLVTESRALPSEAILKCRKLEMPGCVEQCTFRQ